MGKMCSCWLWSLLISNLCLDFFLYNHFPFLKVTLNWESWLKVHIHTQWLYLHNRYYAIQHVSILECWERDRMLCKHIPETWREIQKLPAHEAEDAATREKIGSYQNEQQELATTCSKKINRIPVNSAVGILFPYQFISPHILGSEMRSPFVSFGNSLLCILGATEL